MTIKAIKDNISEIRTLFEFEYNGKAGNIDPYSENSFLLYFDGKEQMVSSIDKVMNTPFIDGHSLNEVGEQLEVIAY